MITLRVRRNGELLGTAGAEDMVVLSAIVTAVGRLGPHTAPRPESAPEITLHLGGLAQQLGQEAEHRRWAESLELVLGDKMEVEVLDLPAADEPTSVTPSVPHRDEKTKFEEAKATYLRLRDKYEPSAPPV